MRSEQDKALVLKYPLTFAHRYRSMQETCMCWGLEVGDGWVKIIDDAASKIEPILEKLRETATVCDCYHENSSHDENGKCKEVSTWRGETTHCRCEKFVPYLPTSSQLKEKYGTLRWYWTSYTKEIDDIVDQAEELSAKTCEECGEPGKIRDESYWVTVRCDKCYAEDCKRWEG